MDSATLEEANIWQIRTFWWISSEYGGYRSHSIYIRCFFGYQRGGFKSFLSRVAQSGFHLEFLLHNCHNCHRIGGCTKNHRYSQTVHLTVQVNIILGGGAHAIQKLRIFGFYCQIFLNRKIEKFNSVITSLTQTSCLFGVQS